MDVPAKIVSFTPGYTTIDLMMAVIEGKFKGHTFDVTMTEELSKKWTPFAVGDKFICSIRNGLGTIKVNYGDDHDTTNR